MLALASGPDETELRTLIEQDLRASQQRLGASRFVRLSFDLGPVEPWRLLRAEGVAERPDRFAWHDEPQDLTFVALGSVSSVEAAGPDRFAAVQRWCSTIAERTADVGRAPSAAPLAVGGFAFADQPASVGPWAGWPAARWWLPEVLVARRAGRAELVLCAERARSAESLAALAARARRALAAEPKLARAAPFAAPVEDEPRERFCHSAEVVRRRIAQGELQKVVLARARRFAAPLQARFDPESTAESLRERERRAMTFLIRGPGSGNAGNSGSSGTFVGASPEILARVDGSRLSTVALAGTRQRDPDPARDRAFEVELLESAKERTEQSIVTSVILQALSPIATSVEHPTEPQIERLRSVVHLRTPIAATLKPGTSPLEAAQRLHPTPAVAGAPIDEALAAIAEHEEQGRGWYAGPVGWLGRGQAAFAVALRSALVLDDEAFAFAGAGIVAASDPEAEWRETALKLSTLERALAARERSP